MSRTAPVRVSQSNIRAIWPSRESPTQCTSSAMTSRVLLSWLAAYAASVIEGAARMKVTMVAGVPMRSRAGSARTRPGFTMSAGYPRRRETRVRHPPDAPPMSVPWSEERRRRRVFHDRGHVGEEPGALLPVDVSMVEGERELGDLAYDDLVVDHPGLLLDRAEAQDGRLTRVDDRSAGVDTEDPDVGDREAAAAHLGRLGLPLASRRGERVERAGELEQAETLGVLDVGYDQPAGRGRRDAEVDVALEDDLLGRLVPVGVDLRRTPHREHARPGHHQQRRDLHVAELAPGLQPLDELHRAGDVDRDPLGDVRRGEGRVDHRLPHHLAHALDRLPALSFRSVIRSGRHGSRFV